MPVAPLSQPAGLVVLFEDQHLLIINKPAGLIVEDSHTHSQTTLEQLLPQQPGLDRNGIVHRLDRDTSGVMVVAKTLSAQANLQNQFKERLVTKEYTALVWGRSRDDHAIINAPIARHPVKGFKFVTMAGGRESQTEFWRQQEFIYRQQPVTLLKVKPHSGRTHQIRVHLAAMNLPIVGDKVYGRRKDPSPIRHFLHAQSIQLHHPETGEQLQFTAPLADDLVAFLQQLAPSPG
jgi:23S rRNA pseudouridine1911/1915/1917 synthase